jgi:N-acetyl-anhydromuramyl-L-alanine amidase AmpD
LLALPLAAGCAGKPPEPLGQITIPSLDVAPVPKHASHASRRKRPAEVKEWAVPIARPWKYIVIHHSATDKGSAALFDRAHRSLGWDELGYHFVINNGNGAGDGKIEVGSRWRKQKHGAHCGGTPDNEYNELGIGVCLVGDFTRRMPSPAQLASLKRLLIYLMGTYDISPMNVIGHRDAPGHVTQCPGEKLQRYLETQLRSELTRRLAAKR